MSDPNPRSPTFTLPQPRSPPAREVTDHTVSLVANTLNEVQNIGSFLDRASATLAKYRNHEIIIVDDNSRDGTQELVRERAARDPHIKLVVNSRRLGILNSTHRGLDLAIYQFRVVMDADLQHPPEALDTLVQKLHEGYDLVVASRYVPGAATVERPALRGLISRAAHIMANVAASEARKTTDPISGFFAIHSRVPVRLPDYQGGTKALLFLLAGSHGMRVADVPYTFHPRRKGQSKLVDASMKYVAHYGVEIFHAARVSSQIRAQRRKGRTVRTDLPPRGGLEAFVPASPETAPPMRMGPSVAPAPSSHLSSSPVGRAPQAPVLSLDADYPVDTSVSTHPATVSEHLHA